jgi:hypothetical protein
LIHKNHSPFSGNPVGKTQPMKTLNETQLHQVAGGEIEPLGMGPNWAPNVITDQEAVADFMAWWSHYTQALGLSNNQQAD